MALKQQAQDLFQTYLYGQRGQQRRQQGQQHILQQQRAYRHDRLLAEVAIGPLASRAPGGGLLREFRLFAFPPVHCSWMTERPPAKSWRVQKLSADLTAD